MRNWFHFVFAVLKVFILFTGCTLLFYYGIIWLNQEYQDYHRYEQPEGSAVKVSTFHKENESWIDRLMLFYHNGE